MKAPLRSLAIGVLAVGVAASTARAGAYRDSVLADAPIGYWRLGDTSVGVAQDETAFDRDLSHININAGDLGRPGAVAGDPDTAVRLSGSSAVLERNLGASPSSDFAFASGQSFSLEYWIRTTQVPPAASNVGLLTKSYDSAQAIPWYLMRMSDTGKADIYLRSPDKVAVGLTSVNDGQWHHVVGVYDTKGGASTTDGELRLYADAKLEGAAGSVPLAAGGTNTRPLVFGRHAGRHYSGWLDELAIYRTALTPDEIFQHYLLGVPEPGVWALLALGLSAWLACRSFERRFD